MKYTYLVGAAFAVFLAACTSTPQVKQATVAEASATHGTATKPTTPPANISTTPAKANSPWSALKDPKNILSRRAVYFDYDQFAVKTSYNDLIEAHQRFLKLEPEAKMLIQGNADERGSSEYNIALGQKRAEAVKQSLVMHGAPEDQIEAVSLGKEKPRNPGHDESAWAENRRADMLYKGKD